jgi:predicted ABC-type ATPase
VKERVLDGGHFVDHKNILLNYNEGLQYLERFADRFDKLKIIHSSKDPGKFTSLLSMEDQQLIYLNDNLPTGVEQTIMNIADRFRGNSSGEDSDEEQGRDHSRGR